MELLKAEIEDVLLLAKHVGLHKMLRLPQQGLLVDEVAADHAALRIFPVADEGPDAVDHPLGLCRLLLSVWQGAQAPQHFTLLRLRFLETLLEALPPRTGPEVLDVAENHW